jgi:hypothetical protein
MEAEINEAGEDFIRPELQPPQSAPAINSASDAAREREGEMSPSLSSHVCLNRPHSQVNRAYGQGKLRRMVSTRTFALPGPPQGNSGNGPAEKHRQGGAAPLLSAGHNHETFPS